MGDDAFLAHLVDHPEQQLAWSVTVDHRYEQARHLGGILEFHQAAAATLIEIRYQSIA